MSIFHKWKHFSSLAIPASNDEKLYWNTNTTTAEHNNLFHINRGECFRWFLSPFSNNCHGILQALLSSDAATKKCIKKCCIFLKSVYLTCYG